jgi:hypothetical protein
VIPVLRDEPVRSIFALFAVEDVDHAPDVGNGIRKLDHFSTTMDMGGRVSWSPQRVAAVPVVDRYPRMLVIWWSALLKTIDFRSVDVL